MRRFLIFIRVALLVVFIKAEDDSQDKDLFQKITNLKTELTNRADADTVEEISLTTVNASQFMISNGSHFFM